MVETVRTVDELINSLFASGQLPHSINEQDVRDAVVSISLETTDLSSLPRSPAGLPVGRLWIDQNLAIRVVTVFQPANIVGNIAMRGAGRLVAEAHLPGAQLVGAVATFDGAGGGSFTGTFRQGNSGVASPAGSGLVVPTPVRRLVGSQEMDGSGVLVPTAKQRMRATRTIGGVGSLTANAQRAGSMVWAAGANIVRENGNLTVRDNHDDTDTTPVSATGNSFKTTGKWYVELYFGFRQGDTRYGIANPSYNADDFVGVDQNSFGIYDLFDGTGTDMYDSAEEAIYGSGGMAPPQEDSIVSVAIDCDHWKFWARLNGGGWCPFGFGTQNPATNQGGADIPAGLRVGGVSIAISLSWGQADTVDMKPTVATWSYTPPSGFVAM